MKILAPLSAVDEVEMLVQSGADELYCGINSQFAQRFGSYSSTNRRLPASANLSDIDALSQVVTTAHTHGAAVHLTLNAPFYSEAMYDALSELALRAEEVGVDGLIVADLGLLLRLSKRETPVLLSSLGRAQNREAARFFFDLGIRRMILPRHLTIEQMRHLVRSVPDVSFEAFILNDGCVFDESLCQTTHAHGAFCFTPWRYSPVDPELSEHLAHYDRWRWFMNNAGCTFSDRGLPNGPCGLCAIAPLRTIGVRYLKIVGREANAYRKLRSVQLVKAVLRHIEEGADEQASAEFARSLRDTEDLCDERYMCYYRD